MTAGVRQGCPLSPLIYALVAEILLDKLELEVPETFTAAYADDTALVIKDFWRDAKKIAQIFEEWKRITGLKLNLKKSIIIPLQENP